ncbi:MAG: hypothetical protein K2Q01_11125 [Rickettsiales bacterium]|nr:hypothetical protein [Rickettsiales bacterium]
MLFFNTASRNAKLSLKKVSKLPDALAEQAAALNSALTPQVEKTRQAAASRAAQAEKNLGHCLAVGLRKMAQLKAAGEK